MTTPLLRSAETDAPILDVLTDRWSPRVFDPADTVDEDALRTALEALRWSPSASNTQPWRLIVARRGTAAHAKLFDALMGFNQVWANSASVLIAFMAETDLAPAPATWAIYDTGQAAAHFSVQAHAAGLFTHQMGGIHADQIRTSFGLSDSIQPITVMAVGTLGDIDAVDEKLRTRELEPRVRRPLSETIVVDD